MERFNRTLEAVLAKMTHENPQAWDIHIPQALFAYRTAVHESTGFTPYSLVFGCTPQLPIDVMLGRNAPVTVSNNYGQFVKALRKQLEHTFTVVRKQLRQSRDKQKTAYDRHREIRNFEIGECVWFHNPTVPTGSTKKLTSFPTGSTKKLTSFWRGPYTVIDKMSPVNYRIQFIGGSQQLVVHVNQLKQCHTEPPTKPEPLG